MTDSTKPPGKPVLNLRVTPEAAVRLDRLSAKYPVLTRHAIARVALERGLEALEADPRWFEKASGS